MKLSAPSWKEVSKVLIKLGYKPSRTRGDHINFVKYGCKTVTVQKVKEMAPNNLMSIIRSTGLTKEEFLVYLRKK